VIGKILATRTVYFTKPKDLDLEKSDFNYKVNNTDNGYEIIITSRNLVKNCYLELPIEGLFTDNYFDVIPGIEKRIEFISNCTKEDIGEKIKFTSLNTIKKAQ
jgi:beta-mannosidase